MTDETTGAVPRPGPRLTTALLGLAALGAIVGAALVGEGDILEAIVTPPALVRAFLVAASVLLGLRLARLSVDRFQAARGDGPDRTDLRDADPVVMLRGIRLAFLAVASFAAGLGWLLASPLPLVVAGIIAAVDVLETSFLLLVVSTRGR